MTTAVDPPIGAPPLSADASARLQGFARACRAATRAIGLYPGEHPTVASTLTHLVAATTQATAGRELTLSVFADTLAMDGKRPVRLDRAVEELGAILHAHQVGAITLQPQASGEEWRRFLALVALPPEQLRRRGGLARLWSSEGQTGIQAHQIDYSLILRERIRGDRATWEAIVAQCLAGDAGLCDDAVANLVMQLLDRPEDAGRLLRAIGERVAGQTDRTAVVVAGILEALAEFVQQTNPDQLEPLLIAMAEAAASMPTEALAAFATRRPAVPGPNGTTTAGLVAQRMTDEALARHTADALHGATGTSDVLDAFVRGFLPDVDRRSTVLALARQMIEQGEGGAATADVQTHIERLLSRHDDRPFVADAYATELSRAAARAVELDRSSGDPADVVDAWCGTVADDRLRILDAQLLIDLMHLRRDPGAWREAADLVVARVVALMAAGDFSPAAFLVEALRLQHEDHPSAEIRAAAGQVLDGLLRGDLIRHIAVHLDRADPAVLAAAKRLCHALGTGVTLHLAEALAREERARPRQHLVNLLTSFGVSGRQSIERLTQSSSPAVRRAAVLLLREFGGEAALQKLEAMLSDREPQVQREATRAVVLLGVQAAFETLVHILVDGDVESRTAVASVLWSLPIEDTAPVLAHLVAAAPQDGDMAGMHERALQRLSGASGAAVVTALATALARGHVLAPRRTTLLRRRAAEALARVGTPDAIEHLHAAAVGGSWGVRRAARAALKGVTESRA